RRKGAPAVAFGRFAAFFRSVVPAAAGAAKMPYRRFLPWNAAAGVVWGAGSALLGYFAGANYEAVVRWMGRAGLILLGAAVLLTGGFFLWRKFTRRAKE
ncbi:MAG TPA: DedA family protein, partial [Thermoanaerobaculia bacterium]|nr:DedA family protein [Thermoanaerobaculia bacterium]